MRVLMAPTGSAGRCPRRRPLQRWPTGGAGPPPATRSTSRRCPTAGPASSTSSRRRCRTPSGRPSRSRTPWPGPSAAELLLHGTTAYVESAQACGLHLLTPAERDPLRTTTYGVGQLLAAALDAGRTGSWSGSAGSATNDGGAGLLAALACAARRGRATSCAPAGWRCATSSG
jgi:glycerate kinase